MSLEGRHAIVTGGGTGVGAAIAQALAGAGASVTIAGRREAPLRAIADGTKRIGWVVMDVTDRASVEAGLTLATTRHGPATILVANAGAADSAPFAKTTPDAFRTAMEVNLIGTVNLWQVGLAALKDRTFGRLIAVASLAGLKGYGYVSAYVAAKHAVVGLTRALAEELGSGGVTVNALCPGFIDTPMLDRSVARIVETTGRSAEEARAMLAAENPGGRLLSVDEVAAAALRVIAADGTGQALAIPEGGA